MKTLIAAMKHNDLDLSTTLTCITVGLQIAQPHLKELTISAVLYVTFKPWG
jgi:hypothetical protein